MDADEAHGFQGCKDFKEAIGSVNGDGRIIDISAFTFTLQR